VELYLCFPCMFSCHAQDSCTFATALPNTNIAMTVKSMFKYLCIVFGSDLNPNSTSLMMTVKYNFYFQFSPLIQFQLQCSVIMTSKATTTQMTNGYLINRTTHSQSQWFTFNCWFTAQNHLIISQA
jgi:hypothetical protein